MPNPVFSTTELRDIVGRAATLDERLTGAYLPCPEPDAETALGRLADWRQAAAAGDATLFARRLAESGYDEASVLPLLDRVSLREDMTLPRWTEAFVQAAEAMLSPSGSEDSADAVLGETLPFAELIWPAAGAAWRSLARRVDPRALHLLTASARRDLRQSLLRRLVHRFAPAMFGDFAIFRHLGAVASGRALFPYWSPDSREVYGAYLAAWRDGRGRALFASRPVAARVLGTTIANWIDSTAEMIERLSRDLAQLSRDFGGSAALGEVTGVDADLSDPHRGGRCVAILRFASGVRIVYKPKDLRIDAAWAGFLGWCQDRGLPVPVAAPRVAPYDGYGWVEFVAADAAGRKQDPRSHFRRAGGLLAILHLLRGIDFHRDNLVDRDGGSVPIDLEALLTPRLSAGTGRDERDPAAEAAQQQLDESVLATHYLPLWVGLGGGDAIQTGGIAQAAGITLVRSRFQHINSDAMMLVDAVPDARPAEQSDSILFAAHVEDLVAGFAAQYRFFATHRSALLGTEGLKSFFSGVRSRVFIEATAIYALIARKASHYQYLGDGIDWSLRFEILCRRGLAKRMRKQDWHILRAERRGLAALDIPMFTLRSDSQDLEAEDDIVIENCLAGTSLDQLIARADRLSDEDLAQQQGLIRAAIGPSRTAYPRAAISDRRPAIDLARHLGRVIEDRAIVVGGNAAWIAICPIDHDHGNLAVPDLALSAGTTGIALFLAALARIGGEARFRDLAMAAIAPARRILTAADGGKRTARLMGIGGASGLGSIMYGLVRIGEILEEPSLLEEAVGLSALLDDERIAEDSVGDVMHGVAGTMLCLLALHRRRAEPAILARATACARHLLQSPAFQTSRGGFSRGPAGIALALLRLGRLVADPECRDAAVDILNRERQSMAKAVRGPAACDDHADPMTSGWCHGAAGIGLARLACSALIDDPEIGREIEAALAAVQQAPSSRFDDLCCGNFARLDFQLTAGLRLDRPELVAQAREAAMQRAAHAVASGFAWRRGDDSVNLGLFQGISGIGYELLRLAEPETLPSILTWD